MAQRNLSEMLAGAVVLVVAAGFLVYALANTGRTSLGGYTLSGRFDSISGLGVGSDVRIAGIKVGSISSTRIDPKTYQAVVSFSVERAVQLPKDSSAQVTSDGLLGGAFLALVPGGDEQMIPDGGVVQITQGAVSLEDLLGKFIFSVGNLATNVQKHLREEDQANGTAPK
jgi:phospholipid/cholesterol/gamma-HCH transport system substrate-binding protein